MGTRRVVWFSVGMYVLVLCIYVIWTYSLTDPNLILSSWPPYWSFQQFMWQTFFLNARLMSQAYVMLVVLLFGAYGAVIHSVYQMQKRSSANWRWKTSIAIVLLCSLPLLGSYNALSHDVFNYVFNAKMVVVYHANPHVQVALDFVRDPWTRFMHNTHTPAPYWYGWTGLTVVPYLIGMGKFTLTWIIFKCLGLLSLLAVLGSWYLWSKWSGKPLRSWLVLAVALNPLVLIEVVSNAHNDLWMLFPAMLSLGLVGYRRLRWVVILASLALLFLSVSTKYATIILLPLWIVIVGTRLIYQTNFKARLASNIQVHFQRIQRFLLSYTPLLASLFLFIPLLSERSKQFLPWYLLWSLVWLPLFHWENHTQRASTQSARVFNTVTLLWTSIVLGFTFSALLRYLPWIRSGEFSPLILQQQLQILWIGGVLIILIIFLCAIMSTWQKD